jgi:hypothetical protein
VVCPTTGESKRCSEQSRRKAVTQSYGATVVSNHQVRRAASVSKQGNGAAARRSATTGERMPLRAVDLPSGRWHGTIEATGSGAFLELCQVAEPRNRMRVRLPEGWRALRQGELRELARRPEVRLWRDEAGLPWRVSVVGPGTDYPYPLRTRHLVFDSERTWAGIVELGGPEELGDLTDFELQRLRDRVCDFGGRRRGYRPPTARGTQSPSNGQAPN